MDDVIVRITQPRNLVESRLVRGQGGGVSDIWRCVRISCRVGKNDVRVVYQRKSNRALLLVDRVNQIGHRGDRGLGAAHRAAAILRGPLSRRCHGQAVSAQGRAIAYFWSYS